MLFKGSSDVFTVVLIVVCAAFAIMTAYWALAIILFAASVVFGIVSWLAARFFRWPVENISIPLALRFQIGRTGLTALLGLMLVMGILIFSGFILYDYQATGIRRIGQGMVEVKQRLGEWGEKLDALAIEGLGSKRFQRWSDWLWEKDMEPDDTAYWLNATDMKMPAKMFELSDAVNAWGVRLEERVFEGEKRFWFLCVYWFVVAVVVPVVVVAFLITVYQLSVKRLFDNLSWHRRVLVSLTTFALVYCLIAVCYLMPYVSHPYHTQGISFWIPTALYVIAGSICCGIVRANHRVLFSNDKTIESMFKK